MVELSCHYKTRFLTIVAHSSTKAEFVAACDAGKIILYLRSILDEIDIAQTEATILSEDDSGAIMMANAGMPTQRTIYI